jgi:hypothetical protein
MIRARKIHLAAFFVGVAMALVAIPVSAQTTLNANDRAAIHECSTRAAKYKDYAQENDHLFTSARACTSAVLSVIR